MQRPSARITQCWPSGADLLSQRFRRMTDVGWRRADIGDLKPGDRKQEPEDSDRKSESEVLPNLAEDKP
jgi:hypothetical protein